MNIQRALGYIASTAVLGTALGVLFAYNSSPSVPNSKLQEWNAKATRIESMENEARKENSRYFKQEIIYDAAKMEEDIRKEMSQYGVADATYDKRYQDSNTGLKELDSRLDNNWVGQDNIGRAFSLRDVSSRTVDYDNPPIVTFPQKR